MCFPCCSESVIQIEERLPWATYLPGTRIKLPPEALFAGKRHSAFVMRKEVHLEGPKYKTQKMNPNVPSV